MGVETLAAAPPRPVAAVRGSSGRSSRRRAAPASHPLAAAHPAVGWAAALAVGLGAAGGAHAAVSSTDAYGRSGAESDRCAVEALKKAAETRAGFSDFSTENNPELYVNIEGCDYSNLDLSNEVLSGVKARGASFANSTFGLEASRADFTGADLRRAVLRSVNLYSTNFSGADLRGADLTGALASGARFGKDPVTKKWAEMEGAILEDTLLSQSDTRELCKNPTLDYDTMAILGC